MSKCQISRPTQVDHYRSRSGIPASGCEFGQNNEPRSGVSNANGFVARKWRSLSLIVSFLAVAIRFAAATSNVAGRPNKHTAAPH
jgi:hypothetical protein